MKIFDKITGEATSSIALYISSRSINNLGPVGAILAITTENVD